MTPTEMKQVERMLQLARLLERTRISGLERTRERARAGRLLAEERVRWEDILAAGATGRQARKARAVVRALERIEEQL